MENVREHCGYVWREEIYCSNGAEELGFQPLVTDSEKAYRSLRDVYDQGQSG